MNSIIDNQKDQEFFAEWQSYQAKRRFINTHQILATKGFQVKPKGRFYKRG